MSVTAIILATDTGTGFAGPKYLARVWGRALIESVVADAVEWPVDRVIVVLGADADAVLDAGVLDGVDVLVDSDWEEGLASPVRAALDLVEPDGSVTHVVMARGDQPGVGTEAVGALIDRAVTAGSGAVIPKYRYARGWPIVLARSAWDGLLAREGALDLLDHLAAHPGIVEEVWIDRLAPRTLEDVDDLPDTRRA